MREALIVWGGWEGHEPEACAARVRAMLEEDGFAVRVEPGTAALAEPGLDRLSLIVPIVTMGRIALDELRGVVAAVEGGVGLAGFHGGMGDAFRDAPEWQFMVGGQFVAHPGDIIDYRVEVTRPDDPVMAGVEPFDHRSEQYYLHVDPGNEVLATTTFDGAHAPWTRDVVMPVVWKRRHGRGRVFYSALGHVASELDLAPIRTILRSGMAWAAGSPATRGTDG